MSDGAAPPFRICGACGADGHDKHACPTLAGQTVRCGRCRQPGHNARTCGAPPNPAPASSPASARHVDITPHLPLVELVARGLARRLPAHITVDDLISAGHLGLIDAAHRYDPARGKSFEVFAEWRIRGAMLDDLRGRDTLSRDMRHLAKGIRKATAQLEAELGRQPAADEVATALGIGVDELHTQQQKLAGDVVLSLDDRGHDGDGKALIDQTADETVPGPFEAAVEQEQRAALAVLIAALPAQMQTVLSLRYGEHLKFREIGDIMRVTESRVCQIHTEATRQLRKPPPAAETTQPANASRRRCSVCRQPGHRRTTCPQNGGAEPKHRPGELSRRPPPPPPPVSVSVPRDPDTDFTDLSPEDDPPPAPPPPKPCSRCQQPGHEARACPMRTRVSSSKVPRQRGGRTEGWLEMRRHLRVVANDVEVDLDDGEPLAKPRCRAECDDVPRPCPFVSCRHNLYLNVNQSTGTIKLNYPEVEPDQMPANGSCALDVADDGGITREAVGVMMRITRERIRQIETLALRKTRAAGYRIGMEDAPDRQHSPLGAAMGEG